MNNGAETSINGSGGRAKEVEIDGASLTIPESGGGFRIERTASACSLPRASPTSDTSPATPLSVLRSMLERFVRGDDRTLKYVNAIEEYVSFNFNRDQRFEDLLEGLATYRPEGGEHLIDEEHLVRKLEYVIRDLPGQKEVP